MCLSTQHRKNKYQYIVAKHSHYFKKALEKLDKYILLIWLFMLYPEKNLKLEYPLILLRKHILAF